MIFVIFGKDGTAKGMTEEIDVTENFMGRNQLIATVETPVKIPFAPGDWIDYYGQIYTALFKERDDINIINILTQFNASSEALGKNDWYIPSCGQLGVIYLCKNDINNALSKMGGAPIDFIHWSSSVKSVYENWVVDMDNGFVSYVEKASDCKFIFVRNF